MGTAPLLGSQIQALCSFISLGYEYYQWSQKLTTSSNSVTEILCQQFMIFGSKVFPDEANVFPHQTIIVLIYTRGHFISPPPSCIKLQCSTDPPLYLCITIKNTQISGDRYQTMAFLLQVWVIVLRREALCFGKLHQIHLAIGIPFPARSSGFPRPVTVEGPYRAARSQ